MPSYTPKEVVLINQHYTRLINSSVNCVEKEKEIRKAFEFAYDAHEGKRHRSGELYITHLLSVAEITVAELKLGPKSAIAALLHHIIEDSQFTLQNIRTLFGDKIADLVDALHRIVNAKDWFQAKQADNFRRLLLAISEDLRVLLIRFADRLHVLRTLKESDKIFRLKIANESLDVYAPLAHRLGMYSVKKELEDLGFKHLRPHVYRVLSSAVHGNEEKRTKFINNFSLRIIGDLTRENIEFKIVGRPKTIFSIWKKIKQKGVSFKEVYDLSAIRIIFKPKPNVPELTQCWKIYEVVSNRYTPIADRLRDWVSVPKSTGYEALHTTLSVGKRFVEVQIRSERMHEIAELGLAAHWKYKKVSSKKEKFDAQIREIQGFLKDPSVDKAALLDDVKLNLLSSDILVFTPENEIKALPKKSTVIDFAYTIHSDLAHKCIGAKINKQIYSISHELSNGDKVEILTSNSEQIAIDWHDFVVTAKAKADIKRHFRVEFEKLQARGSRMLSHALDDANVRVNTDIQRKLLEEFSLKNLADLQLKIGQEKIKEPQLRKVLKIKTRFRYVRFWTILLDLPEVFTISQSQKLSRLASNPEVEIYCGATNPSNPFVISPCCRPRPSDTVVIQMSEDGTCYAHKKHCVHLPPSTDPNTLVLQAQWRKQKARAEMIQLHFEGIDRYGLLSELTALLDEDYAVVVNTLFYKSENGQLKGYFDILVPSSNTLETLMRKINRLPEIKKLVQKDPLD